MSDKTFCNISDIKIDARRQRKYFNPEALAELKRSIEKHGQLQPIIIDHQFNLIAGERRLKCCTELNIPVWYVHSDSVTEVQKKEIELEENLRREGLQWHETAEAVLELHHLKCAEYGKAGQGRSAKGWTRADTANSLDFSRQSADLYIRLGELCRVNEEVKKCPSLREALAFLKRLKEGEVLQVLKETVTAATPVIDEESGEAETVPHFLVMRHGDSIAGLQELDAESVDIIYCDPMWGEDIDEKIRYAEVICDDKDKCRQVIKDFVKEAYRVMRNDRWMVMWFGITSYDWITNLLKEHGFGYDPIPIIWTKPNGIANDLSYSFGRAYETALMIKKGSPIIYEKRTINHFLVAPVPNKRHDFEKPVALAEQILRALTQPGMVMVDGFMGSGTSIVAGWKCQLQPLGWEVDGANFNIAVETWEKEINQR